MNKNVTEVCLLLDRTGSMSHIRDQAISYVNKFLCEQRNVTDAGECRFSLTQFDQFRDEPVTEVVHKRVPIADVPELTERTYMPRGRTPLWDAMGMTITEFGKWVAETPEDDRPGKVVFVVMTDGYENASREFSKSRVREMIERQEKDYNWQFIFLGANMDGEAEGMGLGVRRGKAATFAHTGVGTAAALRTTSDKISRFRRTGDQRDLDFTDRERRDMAGDGGKA